MDAFHGEDIALLYSDIMNVFHVEDIVIIS